MGGFFHSQHQELVSLHAHCPMSQFHGFTDTSSNDKKQPLHNLLISLHALHIRGNYVMQGMKQSTSLICTLLPYPIDILTKMETPE